MRTCISLLVVLATLPGCDKDEDDAVDRGVALKAAYLDALCAAASDPACVTDDATCAFQPYASVEACESVVNVSFSDCPNLWVPLSEVEAEVEACVAALESLTCGAEGLCDADGYSVLPLPECEVVVDLQGLWCEGADTF